MRLRTTVESILNKYAVGSSWWSLFRVLAWSVFHLVWLAAVLPSILDISGPKQFPANKQVVQMTREKGDTDPFNVRAEGDGSTFRIAWVGGSEVQAGDLQIPVDVSRSLESVDGHPVVLDYYLLQAARPLDLLAAVRRAVATRPDFVVVSVNPLYAVQSFSESNWPSLVPEHLRSLVRSPSGAGINLLLPYTVPGQIVDAVAQPIGPAIADRWTFGRKAQSKIGAWTGLGEAVDKGEDPLGPIRQLKGPHEFWLAADADFGNAKSAEMLEFSDGSASFESIRQIVSVLGAADIDAYVGLGQIDLDVVNELERGPADLAAVERRFENATGDHGTRVRVNPKVMSRYLDRPVYRDMIHLKEGGPASEYILGELCATLKSGGRTLNCEP